MPKIFGMILTVAMMFLPPMAPSGTSQLGEPTFEVASVKVNTSNAGPRLVRPLTGGQLSAVNTPLSDLILFAYGFLGVDFRMVGAPGWAATTRYDVSAKMDSGHVQPDGTFAIEDIRAMTRSLLQARFKLAAHMENRDVPIYALVKARTDGKLGARLQRPGPVCPPVVFPAGVPPPPPPPAPPGTAGPPPADWNCTGLSFPGHMSARKTTIPRFAEMLSIFVRRIVVDRTGLDGVFDVDLDYLPDPAIAQQSVGGRAAGVPPPGSDPNLPEIFTALDEQLGLKLDSTRGLADVLVVDRVEPPTPD
jgi:uncharacterized protein (TIGR03435 family)